ncbi:RHS repeat-associated core domain-containing protein, partial [Kordia jejudonensis]|uniref:RHS repeat-associated core domain-containing protein n=1 Tax=Kordia jejudonensis TaxID=1348245 RepID=UPI0006299338
YYPFGLKQKGYNSLITGRNHNYGFGGKEENDELGLQWLDFSARNYDASLGRWMNIDPLAESMNEWSPYNYAFDDPIRFIDPDGMAPQDTYGVNANGDITHIDDKKYYDEDGNEVDRLHKVTDKGQKTTKFVDVKKGVLGDPKKTTERGVKVDYIMLDGDSENSTEVYRFLANNTDVEWFQVQYGDSWADMDKSYIGTGHHKSKGYGHNKLTDRALAKSDAVESSHSHPKKGGIPGYSGPSGFHPKDKNDGDREVAKYYYNKPVKLTVYDAKTGKTILYDKRGKVSTRKN